MSDQLNRGQETETNLTTTTGGGWLDGGLGFALRQPLGIRRGISADGEVKF